MTQCDPTAAMSTGATSGPTRRQVLMTGGVVVAAVAVTAACGSSPETPGLVRPGSTLGADGTLSVSDVPVGGGVLLETKQVVVTQPTEGTFKAFSAICTHEGCIVTDFADNTITCPCHLGRFSATDGSVLGGPPPAPLSEVALTVSGSTITLG